MEAISTLQSKSYPDLANSPFQFKHNTEADDHNSSILQLHKFDLKRTLSNTTKGTHLEYGSEFRLSEDLNILLFNHPLWPRAAEI